MRSNIIKALAAALLLIAARPSMAATTVTDHGAAGGVGLTAYTAPTAWTPTTGDVVLGIVETNSSSALAVPTAWGTWQTILDRNGGSHTADGNGNYWSVVAVVVGASPVSAAPSVGVPGGGSGDAYWVEVSGLDTSSLASLIVQFNYAAKTSTSGDNTMATTLSTFASPSDLSLVEKYGYGGQPWTTASPLAILSQYSTGTYDALAMATYVGQA